MPFLPPNQQRQSTEGINECHSSVHVWFMIGMELASHISRVVVLTPLRGLNTRCAWCVLQLLDTFKPKIKYVKICTFYLQDVLRFKRWEHMLFIQSCGGRGVGMVSYIVSKLSVSL